MARRLRIVNATRGVTLAEDATLADSLWTRLRGLLGTSELKAGAGLVIDPCNSIHTWFMAYAIDVLFLDDAGVVVKVLPAVPPWRVTRPYLNARRVVELPAGALVGTGTAEGDRIEQLPLDAT